MLAMQILFLEQRQHHVQKPISLGKTTYLVMVHSMMSGDDCDDSEADCDDDNYSWLPFEQGGFSAEAAERAQV